MTMPDSGADPFAALMLAPTLDRAAVKRAYFAALQRHPPQTDPDGFRRVRDAYEALASPEGLARAFAHRPIDFTAELRRWDERFAARIEAAVRAHATAQVRAAALRRFVDELSGRTLGEVVGDGRR